MTVARSQLVDVNLTRWYHVISKTVRGAFLLREGDDDRKQWIEDRLELLASVFAIEIGGFAILDNHLHVLVRLEPEQLDGESDEDTLRRWAVVFPPRGADRKPLEKIDAWVKANLVDKAFIQKCRKRLADLGWFMKCLKEPLARKANKAEKQTGAFWQSRYKSIAILDDEALLATCAYIDLNPVAAGMAKLPEKSKHTSAKARVDDCRKSGRLDDLRAAKRGSVAGVKSAAGIGANFWLCPIEDARERGDSRTGLLDGVSLGSYLQLLDYTGRLVRNGKARISAEVALILDRLGTSSSVWQHTIKKMFTKSQQGHAFSFHRDRLRAAAEQRGVQRMANLNGCAATG